MTKKTTSFDDLWDEIDQERAPPKSPTQRVLDTEVQYTPLIREKLNEPPEFFGTICMPEHCLDGCPGQLVELVATSTGGRQHHGAVIRLLEARGVFQVGDEVTVDADAGEWKEA